MSTETICFSPSIEAKSEEWFTVLSWGPSDIAVAGKRDEFARLVTTIRERRATTFRLCTVDATRDGVRFVTETHDITVAFSEAEQLLAQVERMLRDYPAVPT